MTRSLAEAGPAADMGEDPADREAFLRDIAARNQRLAALSLAEASPTYYTDEATGELQFAHTD